MAAPSQVHSLGAPVTLNGPVVSSEYGRARLVDGSLDQPCRMGWGTVQITLDLRQTRTPNLVGVLNHNIDFDRVIGVTNEAGLDRGFGARDPNCWIDLRGFPTTARYWTLAINNNSIRSASARLSLRRRPSSAMGSGTGSRGSPRSSAIRASGT